MRATLDWFPGGTDRKSSEWVPWELLHGQGFVAQSSQHHYGAKVKKHDQER